MAKNIFYKKSKTEQEDYQQNLVEQPEEMCSHV